MIAEIVAIGDELLHAGRIDTNSSYLASQLQVLGVVVHRFTVVDDDPDRLRQAIADACQRADVVIATGGLGPTLDDRTRAAVAAVLDEPLRFDESSWQQVLRWFERHGRRVPDSNRRQAQLPQSATVLANSVGTAPGFVVRVHRAELFALPGVPREMQVMLAEHVLPRVRELGGGLTPTAQACLRVLGPSEALLGERLAAFMQPGSNPSVGITAQGGLLSVRLVARAESEAEAQRLCEQTAQQLRPLLGDWLFAEGVLEVPEMVLERLRLDGQTIAFAESCTGGLCAAHLTDVAGSSAVLQGCVVAYSNAAKIALLGVPKESIEQHGAVSEQVAMAMAAGARERFGADIGMATTGIAGPAGGSADKPVGTVCFAIATGAAAATADLDQDPDPAGTGGPRSGCAGTGGDRAWTVRIADLGRTFVRHRAVFEVWRALLP